VTYTALTNGEFGISPSAMLPAAVVTFFACRSLFRWLLCRAGAWIVARSRD
jgi:hypothetical protein